MYLRVFFSSVLRDTRSKHLQHILHEHKLVSSKKLTPSHHPNWKNSYLSNTICNISSFRMTKLTNRFTMLPQLLLAVCLSVIHSGKAMSIQTSNRIVVAGATGRVGSLVITELLNQEGTFKVRALVRDLEKAKKTLPPPSERLEIIKCDLGTKSDLNKACKDSDTLIWCATGFSENSSPFNKFLALFKLKFTPKESIDVAALSQIGDIFRKKITEDSNAPQVWIIHTLLFISSHPTHCSSSFEMFCNHWLIFSLFGAL